MAIEYVAEHDLYTCDYGPCGEQKQVFKGDPDPFISLRLHANHNRQFCSDMCCCRWLEHYLGWPIHREPRRPCTRVGGCLREQGMTCCCDDGSCD